MTRTALKRLAASLLALGLLLAMLAGWVGWLNARDEPDVSRPGGVSAATPDQIERGAYLARAGNCAACHTVRGGAAFAGGPGIATPFGTVYGGNLTPDPRHGIGAWSASEFYRALHNGRSRDGRLLYPAFPYTSFTQVSRADADALFGYLRSLPPSDRPNQPHELRWPYSLQASLAVWRALYFRPQQHRDDPAQTAEWNRGAYLVRGLGHCAACHSARNPLGASASENDRAMDLAGGMIPMQNWYAPALTSTGEAGVADWPHDQVVALLQTGVSARGWVTGPMAEVVLRSTQHLTHEDLGAVARYLQSLPQAPSTPSVAAAKPLVSVAARGAKLYEQHCAQCHGDNGQGSAPAYPPLAGNRAVTMASPANLVQIVLNGGFAPATAGNPRPYGMPPFVLTLNDSDIAAVLTHLRSAWGNVAAPVSELEVNRLRAGTQR